MTDETGRPSGPDDAGTRGPEPQYGQRAPYGEWAPPDQAPYQGLGAPGTPYPSPAESMWQAPAYGGPVPAWQSRYGQADDPFHGVRVADAGPRLGARILDWLIVGIPFGVLGFVLGFYAEPVPAPATSDAMPVIDGLSVALGLAELVVRLIYHAAFVAFKGATPGKMACSIRVIDERTGGRLSFWRALGRELVLQLSGMLCLIGYFSLFFDSLGLKRGWHDRAVHSRVVRS